jgi:phosphotransferase system enzyme I (PtsI)
VRAAFFSIGSNDLAQYTPRCRSYQRRCFDPLSAALRCGAATDRAGLSGAAARAHLPVCVCGEIAGVPELASLLVGLGVFQLSMNPANISGVKERLSETALAEARAAARSVLNIYV